jgi:hypothetical protein
MPAAAVAKIAAKVPFSAGSRANQTTRCGRGIILPARQKGIRMSKPLVDPSQSSELETFIALAGRIEGLKEPTGDFGWISIGPGDV